MTQAPPLNSKQLRFVELYQNGLAAGKPNGAQAYIDAGYGCSRSSAHAAAARLLADVRVQQLLTPAKQAAEVVRTEQVRSIEATSVAVLERFWAIATADPNELIELRRTCCRYCYGSGFRYQRTQGEVERDRVAHEADKKKSGVPFDLLGGTGYDPRKAPHASCPECFGEGVEQVFAKDTRNLSRAARCLYAGVKVTKEGLEVKMHDQQAALVNVGKILGTFEADEKGRAPTTNVTVNLTTLSDDDLDRLDAILDRASGPALAPVGSVRPAEPGGGESGAGAAQAQ